MAFFIDEARIRAIGGNGGNGCISFRREKYVAMGGPNGGNGGNGGQVIFRVTDNIFTLANLKGKYLYRADKGRHGEGKDKTGACGEDLIIEVPKGTLIKDEDTKQVLCDLVESGQEYIAARGGRGGRGNASYKTSVNQAPRMAEEGEEGQIRNLVVELKVLADVGLVGFPNAGKSTLITSLSNAHPEIGAYPFTTLTPHLGVVKISGWEQFIMADIPGIIEGAHEGKGLGLRFLKHIERNKVLLYVVDIYEDEIGSTFNILKNELASYKEGELLKKPFLVVVNKIDVYPEEMLEEHLTEFLAATGLRKEEVFFISGLKKQGLKELREELYHKVQKVKEEEKAALDKESDEVLSQEEEI